MINWSRGRAGARNSKPASKPVATIYARSGDPIAMCSDADISTSDGRRHGVTIFEPYDLQTNTRQTHVGQRSIRREADLRFVDARKSYRVALAMEA